MYSCMTFSNDLKKKMNDSLGIYIAKCKVTLKLLSHKIYIIQQNIQTLKRFHEWFSIKISLLVIAYMELCSIKNY